MSRIAYLLALVLIVIQTAGGAEVFMSTRERITFEENLTLVVMDVESEAGGGWLELREDGVAIESSVLRTGERFVFDERGEGLEVLVLRIYAGGAMDQVDLEIVSGKVVERSAPDLSGGPVPDGDHRPSADSSLLNWGLAALMVLLLAAWGLLLLRSRRR
jgi:hypothetical protein